MDRGSGTIRIIPPMKRLSMFVLVCVLAVSCGGEGGEDDGTDTGTSGREFDRCTLLTAEEAEQWLGSPVDGVGPADLPVGAESTCELESTANEMILLIQVEDGEQYFASEGSGARGPVTITGLGEDAHSDGDSVSFLQNSFAVRVSRIQGVIPVEDLEEIAHIIESRLP